MSFLGFKTPWPFRKRKTPLVTILMPCKDPHPGFFKEAVQSVIGQTSKDWHLIIIDDHSSKQETFDAFERINWAGDERIQIIKSSSKQITGALNTGMRHATTSYVCSLHCDDLLAPDAIKILNGYITANPHIDYFHSARQFIDHVGAKISNIYYPKMNFKVEDFKSEGVIKVLHCWRVEAARKIGGMDESLGLHGGDDYDFPWCMAEAGCVFKAVPECLYYYRDHREYTRLTTHVPLSIQLAELEKIFKKHGMTLVEIKKELECRKSGYLRQALFLDEADKKQKEQSDFGLRSGWREKYS